MKESPSKTKSPAKESPSKDTSLANESSGKEPSLTKEAEIVVKKEPEDDSEDDSEGDSSGGSSGNSSESDHDENGRKHCNIYICNKFVAGLTYIVYMYTVNNNYCK